MPVRNRILASALIVSALAASTASGVRAAQHPPSQHPAAKNTSNHVVVPQGWPKQMLIPKIKVKANIESLALNKPQDSHAPYNWGDVAWYDLGAKPGDVGRAIMFGHVDSTCCPAVFWNLKELKKGDTIQIAYKNGKPLTFRVMWQGTYLNSKLPVKFMYGTTTEHGLVVFTCSGIFHRDGTGYDHKLLVYARLVLPNGKLG